ncbi:MAG: prepilin peptidase [Clostridiales bacterium]|nr:prepilin peptidase [Clostridiales bacterium]
MEQKHLSIMIPCLAVIGGVIGWRAGLTLRAIYLVLLLAVAAIVFYVDALHRIIPNELVLAIPVLAAGFGLTGAIPFDIVSSLIGFAACFLVFFIPGVFGKKIGAGDVKLAAAMGFALGLTGSLYAVAGMGALVLLYVLFARGMPLAERLKSTIPMGPFLALALVVVSVI